MVAGANFFGALLGYAAQKSKHAWKATLWNNMKEVADEKNYGADDSAPEAVVYFPPQPAAPDAQLD